MSETPGILKGFALGAGSVVASAAMPAAAFGTAIVTKADTLFTPICLAGAIAGTFTYLGACSTAALRIIEKDSEFPRGFSRGFLSATLAGAAAVAALMASIEEPPPPQEPIHASSTSDLVITAEPSFTRAPV